MPTSIEPIDRPALSLIDFGEPHAARLPEAATRAEKWPLRAISPTIARATRLACNTHLASMVQSVFGIEAWQAAVREETSVSGEAYAQPGTLELAHPAGRISVRFDLAAYPALDVAAWHAHGGAGLLSDAERALRVAVAGAMLEPLLEALVTLGLRDLRVLRLVRGPHEPIAHTDVAPFDLSFALHGRRHDAMVAIDPALLPLLETSLAARADALPYAWTCLDPLIPGRLILGARRLPIETLRALAPGDVLLRSLASALSPLVAGTAEHIAARATAAWGTPGLTRLHAPVTIDQHTLLIAKEPTMTEKFEPAPPSDPLASDQPDHPIDIGELDLPVQFEVDTVALPLSQLQALRPGYVLELSTPVAEAQLKLVTHGQTIGYGELVTVGEHLGIRILRMAHGDGSIQ